MVDLRYTVLELPEKTQRGCFGHHPLQIIPVLGSAGAY
ncbi:hypothetical protein SAMN05660473_04160 [Arthrobacter sp. 49Tsu3.1M3]|nr:hypothetical protein SAMN05660473_04160 [Arthrobacter sp. 49Tsu3.1M3]